MAKIAGQEAESPWLTRCKARAEQISKMKSSPLNLDTLLDLIADINEQMKEAGE
jgi:hypothetical protein